MVAGTLIILYNVPDPLYLPCFQLIYKGFVVKLLDGLSDKSIQRNQKTKTSPTKPIIFRMNCCTTTISLTGIVAHI